jgi:catechol 2,3-dioxygenase-like lactoylglutathione lyase family enzyme
MPLGHLGLTVPDLGEARAYYDTLLPSLGYEPFFARDDECAYLPSGGKRGTFLFLYPGSPDLAFDADRAGLQHLAFTVPTRQSVRDAHAVAMRLGSEPVHAPQPWPQYPPPYYAAFWRAPHGFLLEAVCHKDLER